METEHALLGHSPGSFIVSKHELPSLACMHTCFKSEIIVLCTAVGDQPKLRDIGIINLY